MKSSKTILLFALLITPAFVGCSEDFLQKDPLGSLTQQTFPVTEEDALLATNAAYAIFRLEWYNCGLCPILDFMSDDAYKGSATSDGLSTQGPYDNFTFSTSQDGLDRWYTALYQGVKAANVVIDKVPEIKMDTILRNRYIGEAKFIRALMYFDLVNAWGGVPLVEHLSPSPQLPRSSKEEVYNLIVSDLLFAAKHLPGKTSLAAEQAGRATKEAAEALLGKTYLFQKDFVNAEKYLLMVIDSKVFGLEPVFTDANGVKGNNGIESVFEIGALETWTTQTGGNFYAVVQGVRGSPNKGWGFNRPSMELRRSFEPGDPRLKGTIIDLGDTLDGVPIIGEPTATDPVVIINEDGDTINIQCYNRKVWAHNPEGSFPILASMAYHKRIIRYADVLLMAAEALNENDKPSQALVYLNVIRERARQGNNSILPDVTVTEKNALRDKILLERRYELALEGLRFWDLVRTGRAPEVLGPLGFVEGKHELLPIPQPQIDISQGVIIQNPNY